MFKLVWPTIIMGLLLDRLQAPFWVWIIYGVVFSVSWAIHIYAALFWQKNTVIDLGKIKGK